MDGKKGVSALERFFLSLLLLITLLVGFGSVNLFLYVELRRLLEDTVRLQATAHFFMFLADRSYRGDENFRVLTGPLTDLRNVFLFRDPSDPVRTVAVQVKEGFVESRINGIFLRLLMVEFLLVFLLALLYEMIIGSFVRRISQREDYTHLLVRSLAHRAFNFMAVQKMNITLLKKRYQDSPLLDRLEKSLRKFELDMGLLMRLARGEVDTRREKVDVCHIMRQLYQLLEEELSKKRFIFRCKEGTSLYMAPADAEELIYNLLYNSAKYSLSFVHVKVCEKNRRVLIVFRNDMMEGLPKGGAGMGTYLVREILKSYRGSMEIKWRGKYYTVFVRLEA
ncbi:ATP-binding region ATPase domain protein [Thermocrinis albus DSM 14484]|uniref:ATP-binding region ATPase domain protein n=1 Tax=Thermocrinis albus (strain DSM 14484 / JCM 11386 / HI 11/12) TaxID=638303 RepID=D3SPK7_THEAH|nr:HAMP domain-containing histidine kinase [Thermocrinis albus]ADC89094.1 ATP-binding region ATPase domain protein [Thermocrinis albus DSM 14484]